jgi:hypothetical protein
VSQVVKGLGRLAMVAAAGLVAFVGFVIVNGTVSAVTASNPSADENRTTALQLFDQGKATFRFETFGDEAFWGGTLQLHRAIEGANLGGVGPGLSPRSALALGLKVDSQVLSSSLKQALASGQGLDDPATTLALLQQNAVIGLKGFFHASGGLSSVGITCAACHSTVDDSFAPGVGRRLDGWANRDLNVGAIIALAPNKQPFADLLGTDQATVTNVLNSWGPGRFDAELFLDGKAFRPDGRTAAVLIPPAFGLAGVNLHTYTGWGSVTYWNALVANLEMHGLGTFYDPRLNDATKFPIAAVNGFGNVRNEPDLITSKLAALHVYELDLQAPTPPAGSFDAAAAQRGAGQSSTGRGNARPATCRRSSPSPDGTCTRRPRSASIRSRPIALRPIVTARPRSRVSSLTPKGASTTMGGSPPSGRSSSTTTRAVTGCPCEPDWERPVAARPAVSDRRAARERPEGRRPDPARGVRAAARATAAAR